MIDIVKIDEEGSELNIIGSALPLFKYKKIRHVVVEFVPARINDLTAYDKASSIVVSLYSYGYKFFPHFDLSPNVGSTTDQTGRTYQRENTLEQILKFLDPDNKVKGRGSPTNYRISLVL